MPQAFDLGEPIGNVPRREFFAPNIGIYFRLVPVGNASGAKLSREPVRDSGAAQLRLGPGDTIYLLDGLPIRMAVDVMNHHGRTEVVYFDVRTNRPRTAVAALPPDTPLPPDVPPEHFAANLGIHYQLIPFKGDSFVRGSVARHPETGPGPPCDWRSVT